MIRPDARSRLTPQDVALVLESVAGEKLSPEDVDIRLLSEDLDAVLDRPELARALQRAPVAGPTPSPSLYFYVLVRHALLARGLDDRILADYVASLLREFGVRDRARRIAAVDDQVHTWMVDIVEDLETATGERQFRVLVHLGNYALWMSGVFPRRIEALRARRGGPDISYYESLGYRGYAEAAGHWLASHVGLAEVYRAAAVHFPVVRSALSDVSRRFWERAA
jgi:hypothetical protein